MPVIAELQRDRGQVEGGFVQGMGWLTGEELVWDAEGRLLTHSSRHLQDSGDRRTSGGFPRALLRECRADRRDPRQQGCRRTAADAGDLRARGDPRCGGGISRPAARCRFASPATPEAIFDAIRSRTSSPRPAETMPEQRDGEPGSFVRRLEHKLESAAAERRRISVRRHATGQCLSGEIRPRMSRSTIDASSDFGARSARSDCLAARISRRSLINGIFHVEGRSSRCGVSRAYRTTRDGAIVIDPHRSPMCSARRLSIRASIQARACRSTLPHVPRAFRQRTWRQAVRGCMPPIRRR